MASCGENVSLRNYSHLIGRHQEQITSFPADRLKVRVVSHRCPWPRDKRGLSERLRRHRHVAFSWPLLHDWKTFVALWNVPDLIARGQEEWYHLHFPEVTGKIHDTLKRLSIFLYFYKLVKLNGIVAVSLLRPNCGNKETLPIRKNRDTKIRGLWAGEFAYRSTPQGIVHGCFLGASFLCVT